MLKKRGQISIFIIVGIIVSIIFVNVRKFILKRTANIVKTKLTQKYNPILTNSSIGRSYNAPVEKVSGSKFATGMLSFFNPVLWLKDLFSLFNIRKLTIYAIILGVIFAYGWYQGTQGKPIKMDIGYGKEALIKLNGHFLHITKDGYVYVEDKDGNKLKQLSVKDIPYLKRKLSPFGLQLKPILVGGYGISDFGKSSPEVGVGVSWLRYYKFRLDSFLTQKGVYPVGVSYKLDGLGLENSAVGVGIGKGYSGDNRAIVYFRVGF